MQLTRQTDYAIRVLMFLGVQQSDELVTISDIAYHFEISRNHLMKIVHKLGQLGYIQTVRGKYGGMRINMEAEEISIGKMIRDFETSLEIVDCEKLIYPLTGSCDMKPMLSKARDAFLGVVDEYTLRDLLKNPTDIRTLLGLDLKEGELPVQVMAAS